MGSYIIDDKLYDTETAQHLASHIREQEIYAEHWVREDLYRSPRGTCFVVATGGLDTQYAGRTEAWTLEDAEAEAWLEARNVSAQVLARFRGLEEG